MFSVQNIYSNKHLYVYKKNKILREKKNQKKTNQKWWQNNPVINTRKTERKEKYL